MLSADYIFVRGELDSNLPLVTNGQKERINELDAQWAKLNAEKEELVKDIAAFNALCREKGIEKITLP